ncbi:sensor histidine kinase [Cellulosimicrobium marinum]|uniref:sensor histidine kinase n=1 Tax=Cellulosimicrobium marinum TaxID=1638992 RepID=UPI001E4503A6|nr:histidine kinase [Cellulosimicrobium marinum]MCB7136121.1 histidine kinase [Cellulosimicrobium marinum]
MSTSVHDCPPLAGPPVLATAAHRRDPTARILPWSWFAAAWAAVAVLTLLSLVPVLAGADVTALGPALDVAVAVAVLALLPFLWSRRPVAVALALAALAAVSGAATPASTVATLHVARWFPVRTALPVAAAGFAGHAVQALWRPVSMPLGWWLLCDLAVHAALLGWGAYGQARAELLRSLRERARRAEVEQERRVAEARLAERARIAREMHDTLAHRLSLLASTAGALEYRPDAPPERLASAAALVRAGVSAALDDLRDVVRVLRDLPDDPQHPDVPPTRPGLGDVPRLVVEARAAGEVTYEREGDAVPPPTVAVAAYRAVQEGLTNARRHAPGSPVTVRVAARAGEVRVVVADGGPRLVPAGPAGPGLRTSTGTGAGTGTGLVGLRERVALLGGRLDAGPRDDGPGFLLDVRLPWDA